MSDYAASGSLPLSGSAEKDCSDRYVSFGDIDFDANIHSVLGYLFCYINNPAITNAFWERFKSRLAMAETKDVSAADKLLLLHSHVYYMVDLFEEYEDEEALAAVAKLEAECF